jgi:lipoate---protein ligase
VKELHIYESYAKTNDPFFNLAFEEWLFKNHDTDSGAHSLFLWCNKPSVIIGRFQNPHRECHLSRMEQHDVELVRRKSGGGAVYQDHGNAIFSFLTPAQRSKAGNRTAVVDANNSILTKALSSFGIEAEASGRNDIVISDSQRKVSGAAFKRERNLFLHHGTMLLDVDFNALSNYLNPNKLKLQSKGVTSVAARVQNLIDLVPDMSLAHWNSALHDAFIAHHSATATVEPKIVHSSIDESLLDKHAELRAMYDGMKEWEWRFGTTPDFSHELNTRFDWGTFTVHVDVHHGKVKDISVFSDVLFPEMVESMRTHLKGAEFTPSAVRDIMNTKVAADLERSPSKEFIEPMTKWLCSEM